MAKQNVTFIERHLEKFVIGVCGATLLAVMVLYLVQSPHTVQMDNQAVGPKEFYRHIRDLADKAKDKMKNARPEESEKGPGDIVITRELSPYKVANLPTHFEVAFVSPSPAIPVLTAGAGLGKIQLAEILPPAKPVLTGGRSMAALPDPEVIVIDLPPGAPTPVNPNSGQIQGKDYVWMTILTTINRKEQRERFEAAGYEALRQTLNVADIEVERQELLADGDWAPAQLVQPYTPKKISGPAELHFVDPKDEEPVIGDDQLNIVKEYNSKLDSYDRQAELLRPAFQQYLVVEKGEPFEWSREFTKLFKETPGFSEVDLTDFNVALLEETTGTHRPAPTGAPAPLKPRKEPERPTGARGPVAGAKAAAAPAKPPTDDKMVMKEVNDKFKEFEKLKAEKNYIKAEEILLAIKALPGLPAPQLDKVEKGLEDLKDDVAQARVALEEKLRQKETKKTLNIGPDIDLVWVNDTTVTPGKTYRYRVRLMAINTYAGLMTSVKDPKDALKMIIPGAPSEWSEPKTAKPDKVIFFTGVVAENKTAKIEINQWANGDWKKKPGMATIEVAVGQPIATGTSKSGLSYDGVVVAIDAQRSIKDKKSGKDVDTAVLTLVNARGDVEVRYALQDFNERQLFVKQRQKDDAWRKEHSEQNPTNLAPRPIGRQPGGLAAPRGQDASKRGS